LKIDAVHEEDSSLGVDWSRDCQRDFISHLERSLGPFRAASANAATGQIYAQVAGFAPKATVYLTSQELAEFYFLLAMSTVPALIGGALGLHWKVFAKAPIRFRPISLD
jgi:hypothetical protein